MPFKVGMYGGKFCPLHEGHYSVIERALSECDGLIVVLFINGEDEAKFERRWFTEPAFRYYQLCKARERYQKEHGLKETPPMNIVIVDSSKFMKDGEEDWYREADWINGQCWFIDAMYSSEPEYDAFFKRAYPEATHVLVDPERKTVPISATKLREMGDFSEELIRWMV